MADKKRDILEFVEQSNFEQMIPTQQNILKHKNKLFQRLGILLCTLMNDKKVNSPSASKK